MEAQLAAYRAKKAKEKEAQKTAQSSTGIFHLFKRNANSNVMGSEFQATETEDSEKFRQKNTNQNIVPGSSDNSAYSRKFDFLLTKPFVLKFILWLALWGLFIVLEFGSVYFIASFFVLIYNTTRTGSRDGKLSAYSVFNPNMERIDGTFTAEQFEKELRYGAGSVGKD